MSYVLRRTPLKGTKDRANPQTPKSTYRDHAGKDAGQLVARPAERRTTGLTPEGELSPEKLASIRQDYHFQQDFQPIPRRKRKPVSQVDEAETCDGLLHALVKLFAHEFPLAFLPISFIEVVACAGRRVRGRGRLWL